MYYGHIWRHCFTNEICVSRLLDFCPLPPIFSSVIHRGPSRSIIFYPDQRSGSHRIESSSVLGVLLSSLKAQTKLGDSVYVCFRFICCVLRLF